MKENNSRMIGLLELNDIMYMFEILNSELAEDEKMKILYNICTYSNVCRSLDNFKYKNSKTREVTMLEAVKEFYEDNLFGIYNRKYKSSYRCSIEEMVIRLEKIVEARNIINTKESDYEKAYKLYLLYNNSYELKKQYTYFIKYGENDERLDFAREALNDFVNVYNKYVEYENNGLIKNAAYFFKNNDYFINYNYAKFVVSCYVNSSDSYKESIFLPELGIGKEIFEFCVKTVEELDVDLYTKYLEKREINKKIRFIKNKKTIEELAVGIKTGFLPNGEIFDMLEFIKMVPFKGKDFASVIEDFMKTSNMSEISIIMNYINSNKLHLPTAFKEIKLDELYNTKMIVGNREITKEDIDYIIEYLNLKNILVTYKTFTFARNKYLAGEINIEKLKKEDSSNNKQTKERVLIPYIGK